MRFLSIDVLRGLAILLMIQVHFVDNLSSRDAAYAWLYDAASWLGMLPAPLFTFLSGVSYCLWLRKQEELRRGDAEINRVSVRRGLFLFGAGIAFNVLVWLPEDTFNWDILTLIGVSLVLLAYVRKLPPGVLALACVMVVLVSPPLRIAADYAAYWRDETYEYDFTLQDVALGFLANAYFPVFPWIVFPCVGFVVADRVFPPPGRPLQFPRWIVVTGAAFLIAALLGALLRGSVSFSIGRHYLSGYTMFPASTEYILATLGLSMLGLVFLSRSIDRNRGSSRVVRSLAFLQLFSAYSLSIYILHHMVHLWPLWIYGVWTEHEPTRYWRQAMSTPAALALAVTCMVSCYLLVFVLERNGRYSFESLLRWFSEEREARGT